MTQKKKLGVIGNLGFGLLIVISIMAVAAATLRAEIVYFDAENSGIASDYVKCAALDRENNKWFGSDIGPGGSLSRFGNDSIWFTYNSYNSGLGSNIVTSLAFDTSDHLWIGTLYGGLFKYHPDSGWKSYATDSNLASVNVSAVIVDKENYLWIGTMGSGINRFDGDSTWLKFNTGNGLTDNRILALFADNQGRIWAGTYSGVEMYDHSWQVFDSANSPLPGNTVRAISQDRGGNIWFGTDQGAARFDGLSNWTIYDSANSGIAYNSVTALAVDSTGDVWFGHKGEEPQKIVISRLHNGAQWTTYNLEHITSVIYADVTTLAVDPGNNIWVGTNGEGIVLMGYDPTDAPERGVSLPQVPYLEQNYPNPFNLSTVIQFSVASRSPVELVIYDILGRKIKTLVNETKLSGTYKALWDGRDDGNNEVPSGVYFYRIKSGTLANSRKMLLLK